MLLTPDTRQPVHQLCQPNSHPRQPVPQLGQPVNQLVRNMTQLRKDKDISDEEDPTPGMGSRDIIFALDQFRLVVFLNKIFNQICSKIICTYQYICCTMQKSEQDLTNFFYLILALRIFLGIEHKVDMIKIKIKCAHFAFPHEFSLYKGCEEMWFFPQIFSLFFLAY